MTTFGSSYLNYHVLKTPDRLANQLTDAVQSIHNEGDFTLSEAQLTQLLLYLDRLLFWNKTYNLTAIKEPEPALIKHVLDCLAIVPHLKSGSLLDIGTGAGLPALIVAICQPERAVTALDSNQKKIRFIKQVVSELQLKNVNAVASRIETFANHNTDNQFEVVTSRAFASLTDFVRLARPCVNDKQGKQGVLQAMKGLAPSDAEKDEAIKELVDRTGRTWQIEVTELDVPRLNEARHLVSIY